MRKPKAFTLIELLVVVAVIALLSTLVLGALMTAKDKAKDSAIMRELSQLRTEAQMILVESGAYNVSGNKLCDAENTLNNGNVNHPFLAEIEEKVKKYNGGNPVVCYASANSYCIKSLLNLETGFCVDSTGQATTLKTTCDADAVCE